jgi:transcriptional regulator with XRE-family HTH domain
VTVLMTAQRFSGRALRRARDAQEPKMTAARLAAVTGISVDTIRDYERGRYAPSADRLALLASVLNVSMDSLFMEPDDTEGE